MWLHRLIAGWLAVCALCFAGCTEEQLDAPQESSAFVDAGYMRARQLEYLRFATASFSPGNVVNVMAHLERARVDPPFSVPPSSVPADAWDPIFTKLANLQDTRDFNALELLNLVYDYDGDPTLAPELWNKVENALLSFKYWYTEPTPAGMLDNSYYWTENHQIIYHTLEYLAGQRYPERTFSSDGASGRVHQERARDLLIDWFTLRARFGFSEWHSNVYYEEDLTPLLTLVEFAEDEEIRTRAAMVVDLLLFDIAMHTHRGAFGTTHGRSYKKDKMSSLDDDTWDLVKLLFDTTDYPFGSRSDEGATLFARTQRYQLPEVILRTARYAAPFADRERMGIAINELGPYEENPRAPYGFSFTDPAALPIWWGMGALTTWPVVPLTVQTLNQYNLWDTTNFAPFKGLQPITEDIKGAQQLAVVLARQLGFGLLTEVNTYTYRTADYMLSSALDYRKGSFGAQQHAWQATFDPNAIVFTTHAFRPPLRTTNWYEDTETGSYWTGEASLPRSAQHENVAIHIYAPQYPATSPPPLDFFRYEPYTHAYFPQDHFDEVVQEAGWTFGRFGDGYIGLYSYRPAEWVVYDPTEYATNGMTQPFDLRADGGADNVWIVECGNADTAGTFAEFRAHVGASVPAITVLPATQGGQPGGFDVVYDSPSQGHVTFGWEAPLTVAGVEIPQHGFPRYDNPWSQTPFDSQVADVARDGFGVHLDFIAATRDVFAP
jgi:hypothetical protein